ncbi:MAG TPA: hypothetical protein DD379_09820 [Cyanobacteria bacterium UBA11162]|nr:hypothetical protein [Cyanobacteria bacterium UBA11162]
MKKLIYAATFTLVLASFAPAVQAAGSLPNAKVPHLVHSSAHPNDALVPNATHHFEVHVQGKGLSELSIDLPQGVSIRNGIEVTNQSGQKINAEVSINDKKATVVFAQPVEPDTTLSINMQGVKTPGYSYTWQYRVYGKLVGINQEISLGSARIQTYR